MATKCDFSQKRLQNIVVFYIGTGILFPQCNHLNTLALKVHNLKFAIVFRVNRCFHFRVFEIFVSSLFLLMFLDFCTYWLSVLYNLKADSQEINYDIRKENKRVQRWARSVVTKIGCTNIDWYANIQQDKARWQMAMLESIFYCNFAENLNSATL